MELQQDSLEDKRRARAARFGMLDEIPVKKTTF